MNFMHINSQTCLKGSVVFETLNQARFISITPISTRLISNLYVRHLTSYNYMVILHASNDPHVCTISFFSYLEKSGKPSKISLYLLQHCLVACSRRQFITCAKIICRSGEHLNCIIQTVPPFFNLPSSYLVHCQYTLNHNVVHIASLYV